jgi:uncharacterized protein YdbL (DUF1318 family)
MKSNLQKMTVQKQTHFLLRASLRSCLTFSLVTSAAIAQTACVTVNVNFPESAVQKATDDYVRDLYKAKEKGKAGTPGAEQTPSASSSSNKVTLSSLFISEAYAEDFKVQSAKADSIKAKLSGRLDDLNTQKRSGAVGEANDGLVAVKDSKLPPLLLKKVKTLVDAENADRMELYHEVAKINGLGGSGTATVQKSFSRSFQSLSPSGSWVQDSGGNWTRKP